jgi:hypothetical protein
MTPHQLMHAIYDELSRARKISLRTEALLRAGLREEAFTLVENLYLRKMSLLNEPVSPTPVIDYRDEEDYKSLTPAQRRKIDPVGIRRNAIRQKAADLEWRGYAHLRRLCIIGAANDAYYLGYVSLIRGRRAMAKEWFKMVIEFLPKHKRARLRLLFLRNV